MRILYNAHHQDAGIAQLVEHDLAKVGVASSSLVSRSKHKEEATLTSGFFLPVIYAIDASASFSFLRKTTEIQGLVTYGD